MINLKPCPFCGNTKVFASYVLKPGGHPPRCVISCIPSGGATCCKIEDKNLPAVADRWNTRALVGDDQKILHAAQTNRIWLNAMHYLRPSDDILSELGLSVLEMLNQPENLVTLDQESPCAATRRLGSLAPVLFLRVTKS